MNLEVRYKSVNEDWEHFELEKGVVITRQRNAMSTAKVKLPKTRITKDFGYGNLQILYGKKYLFDGTIATKSIDKDIVNFTANDQLFAIGRERRNFEQSTDDLTTSQMITNVFDQDGDSSYIDGVFLFDYTDPWIAGYDAKTFVVPSETTYSDFYDCNNKNGIEYMEFLADASNHGLTKRFFYWFDNIDGSWYLFFQPDAWGKTWKNLSYTVKEKLQERYEEIWNNIVVWGEHRRGFIPEHDRWTEVDMSGWHGGASSDYSKSEDYATSGKYSLKHVMGGTITFASQIHRFASTWNAGVNMATFNGCNFDIRVPTGLFQPRIRVDLQTSPSSYFSSSSINLSVGGSGNPAGWENCNWTREDFSVGTGSPTWDSIWTIWIDIRDIGADQNLTGTWYTDNFYLSLDPVISGNVDETDGYSATSAAIYGKRTPVPIMLGWANHPDDCSSFAANLLGYYKNPQHFSDISFDSFMPFQLNENILLKEDIALPIDSLSWNFGPDNAVKTSVKLGISRANVPDILKKYSTKFSEDQYDRGIMYYIAM